MTKSVIIGIIKSNKYFFLNLNLDFAKLMPKNKKVTGKKHVPI